MAKRRRRLSGFGKLVIFCLIFLLSFFVIKIFINKEINVINNYNDINGDNNGINTLKTSESDTDVIQDIFAKGLSINEYNKILNKKSNYITTKGKYIETTYDFDSKLHYSEIEDMLINFNRSDIVKLENIGSSVDGRTIYGIEVGKGKKVLYLDANVHAAEVANTLFLMRFLTEILNDYENNDKYTVETLNDVKIVLIPSMNPDGYEVYNFGVESLNNKKLWWYLNKDTYSFANMKSNANGVDLNRNFPTQNAGLYYKSNSLINSVALEKTTKNGIYFGGTSLGSEPETKAAMYFMLKHYKNTYAYINMHSQGRVIYAGKPNLSDEFNKITNSFAKKVSSFNNYTVYGLSSEEVGEGNDGSVTDFMAELANGFVFSSDTGRLSTNKYIDNSCTLKYKYPVITMESLKTYTTDPTIFKDEYYNYGIKDLLHNLIDSNF